MSERGINPLELSLEQLSAYRTQVIISLYHYYYVMINKLNYY